MTPRPVRFASLIRPRSDLRMTTPAFNHLRVAQVGMDSQSGKPYTDCRQRPDRR